MTRSPDRPVPSREKVKSRRALAAIVTRQQQTGRRVVFANGCFDVVHAGHVTLLEQARRLGDALVVGINSDRSVRALKGASRPIIGEADRARLIAALACVDYVTIFDEDTPYELIRALRPKVLVKGADWAADQIVGRDVVEQAGGRVARVSLIKGRSTTELIRQIRRLPGDA